MFKVGDKIVCIREFENNTGYSIITPIVDKMYTIRTIGNDVGGTWFHVNEITNIPLPNGVECGFYSDWFRKVDESFAEGILENILEKINKEQLQEI